MKDLKKLFILMIMFAFLVQIPAIAADKKEFHPQQRTTEASGGLAIMRAVNTLIIKRYSPKQSMV